MNASTLHLADRIRKYKPKYTIFEKILDFMLALSFGKRIKGKFYFIFHKNHQIFRKKNYI